MRVAIYARVSTDDKSLLLIPEAPATCSNVKPRPPPLCDDGHNFLLFLARVQQCVGCGSRSGRRVGSSTGADVARRSAYRNRHRIGYGREGQCC
jgi:hypothetical protein